MNKFRSCDEGSPDFRHLGELTVATGIHAHDRLLEQMNLRQRAYLAWIKHPFDIRIRGVRVRMVRQDALANLLHTLFYW